MGSVAAAALRSWQWEPWVVASAVLSFAIYFHGWRQLQRQMPRRFGIWRLIAFATGLGVVLFAIVSPLDAFANLLLEVHMTQHLLLMMVAPPLIWLGAPATPMLRGLPPALVKNGLGPFLASPGLRRFFARWLGHPAVCWTAFAVTTWTWHVPALYELALRSRGWHQVEHLCFFGAALLFWWPVIQPWPSRAHWPRWAMIPYLLLAHVANTIFAAVFTFAGRVIYPTYAAAPRLAGISALTDQALAGAIMWVPGSLVLLVAVSWIVLDLLSPARVAPETVELAAGAASIAVRRSRRRDLLALPVVGRVVGWRHFRTAAQAALFLLALAVIADGLLGPRMSPMNLAGVLPWTYWRGFVVVGLLAGGNLFCMACPFTLPRAIGRRLFGKRLQWPQRLRSKWVAVVLLLLYLWAYEAFGLWDSPWWTAWITIGYFAAAFAVDGFFRNASFCKYVCPIGQFNFVHSLISPLEVAVREPAACRSCTTHDCLRGNERQRGCELDLFQPEKVGNMDCTFCLDCIHACPHDNVGILAGAPGRDLLHDPFRSSLRRFSSRPDVAVLALVLVFGAFANAAAMVRPVLAWRADVLPSAAGAGGWVVALALMSAAVLALPVLLAVSCGLGGRLLGGVRAG